MSELDLMRYDDDALAVNRNVASVLLNCFSGRNPEKFQRCLAIYDRILIEQTRRINMAPNIR